MNLRAPVLVASFAIRLTPKIRSRHVFRYKYGCWKSVGERPQERSQEKLQETLPEKLHGEKEDRTEDVLAYAIVLLCRVE